MRSTGRRSQGQRRQSDKGIFVLIKTSNPSNGEFQDRLVDGRALHELAGEKVAEWGADCMSPDGSYSNVGAVVGATYPEQGKILRKLMPKTFILVPGYGAQGGKGADLVHYFNEDGLGAVINSSRGIIAAYKQEHWQEGSKFICAGFRSSGKARTALANIDIDRLSPMDLPYCNPWANLLLIL